MEETRPNTCTRSLLRQAFHSPELNSNHSQSKPESFSWVGISSESRWNKQDLQQGWKVVSENPFPPDSKPLLATDEYTLAIPPLPVDSKSLYLNVSFALSPPPLFGYSLLTMSNHTHAHITEFVSLWKHGFVLVHRTNTLQRPVLTFLAIVS